MQFSYQLGFANTLVQYTDLFATNMDTSEDAANLDGLPLHVKAGLRKKAEQTGWSVGTVLAMKKRATQTGWSERTASLQIAVSSRVRLLT